MESLLLVCIITGVAFVFVGAGYTIFKTYQLVRTDAQTRGIKFPRLWGLLAVSANNGVGLLIYLLSRHNHPVLEITDKEENFIQLCKKRATVGIIFMVVGALICIWSIVLLENS